LRSARSTACSRRQMRSHCACRSGAAKPQRLKRSSSASVAGP
jgi:hypothetical protein